MNHRQRRRRTSSGPGRNWEDRQKRPTQHVQRRRPTRAPHDMGDVTGCATSTRTHSAEQREETRRLTSSVNGQIFKKIAWQGESHDDACGAGCCRLVACTEFFLRLLQFHPVSSSCQRDSASCTMLCRGLSDCLMALHILSRSGISFLGRSQIKPFHSWVILATNPRFGSTHPVRGDSILNSGGFGRPLNSLRLGGTLFACVLLFYIVASACSASCLDDLLASILSAQATARGYIRAGWGSDLGSCLPRSAFAR